MKSDYEMTYKQYYTCRIDSMAKENDLTKTECTAFYPADSLMLEYNNMIISGAANGCILPRIVLDKLCPDVRYRILHDYGRNKQYAGYIVPEVRKVV